MVDIDTQIQLIHEKLQRLLKQQQMLQKENQRLQTELADKKQLLETKEALTNNLSGQLDALRLGTSGYSAEEKQALRVRVNAYLKEIDKCLALLNV